MKKQAGKKLLKDLQALAILPDDANEFINDEVEEHLEEKLTEKEEKNKKEFIKIKIDSSIFFKREQHELYIANFTF